MIPPMTILITAGPTREALDPVRFLTNKSSGKMGYAIAKTAAQQGHRVILISGPTHLNVPDLVDYVPVESTQEMYDAVEHWIKKADIAIFAAAVADYQPINISEQKIKKDAETMNQNEILLISADYIEKPPKASKQHLSHIILEHAVNLAAPRNMD